MQIQIFVADASSHGLNESRDVEAEASCPWATNQTEQNPFKQLKPLKTDKTQAFDPIPLLFARPSTVPPRAS